MNPNIIRMLLIFVMICLLLVTEIAQISLHNIDSESAKDMIFLVQGQLTYFLMYSVCLLGPIDIAKVAMLRDNAKYCAMFFGLACCSYNLLQGFFFDMLIFFYIDSRYERDSDRYYPLKGMEIVLTLVAMWGMYSHILRAEMKEVRIINKSQMQNQKMGRLLTETSSSQSSNSHYLPFPPAPRK